MAKLRADKYGPVRGAEIFASFGNMGYWHLVRGAPSGTLTERAEGLLALVQQYLEQPAERWPIRPIIVHGMALELTDAFTQAGEPASPALLHLLSALLKLPASFLADPIPIYSGKDGRGQPSDPRLRTEASWIEAYHLKKHRKRISASSLAKQLKVSRDTVAGWRKESDYKDFVDFVGCRK
jgi:hypothetical protein